MTDRDTHEPVPIKDGESEQPVAQVWRDPLREIVRAFVRRDYGLTKGVAGVEPVDPAKAEQIRAYIADYGATLVELPDDTWRTSVAMWYGSHWEVFVDLWTAEEGCSDLVLDCWVHEAADGYRVAVHLVYVP